MCRNLLVASQTVICHLKLKPHNFKESSKYFEIIPQNFQFPLKPIFYRTIF